MQLKSIIAAVSSSKPTGRKHFNLWGIHFGWSQIIALWNRELDRARRCCMLRVPKLKYRHIFRDPWTRLNVSPAKIMQVNGKCFSCVFIYFVYEGWRMRHQPSSSSINQSCHLINSCRNKFVRVDELYHHSY